MTTTERKELEQLIEQKILEFLGDPDSGLELRKPLLARLKKSVAQKNRKLTLHADVLKKYSLS